MKELSILVRSSLRLVQLQDKRPPRHNPCINPKSNSIKILQERKTHKIQHHQLKKKKKSLLTWSSGKKVTPNYTLQHWRLSRTLLSIPTNIQKKEIRFIFEKLAFVFTEKQALAFLKLKFPNLWKLQIFISLRKPCLYPPNKLSPFQIPIPTKNPTSLTDPITISSRTPLSLSTFQA